MTDDSYDADDAEEMAELWGVSADVAEDMLEALAGDNPDFDYTVGDSSDLIAYIEDLYEALQEQYGEDFDLELSDLWDLYYGVSD